jgi:hypothetical protein
LATPGTIRITAATLQLVEGLIRVNALGPVPVKGLTESVEAPEAPLRLGLTHLQAAEFLYGTRLFPEIEYTFKHALTL